MMNRSSSDPDRAPETEPVWERPWSVEEIRESSQNWSLAADAGLLQFLQEFSQQTISRTHEIKKQLDGLIRETKATDCRLHNVFNDFLMLSNTQFIENRVYDEEVEEPVLKAETEKMEQEKTREQKEVDLIPKVQEAVNYGLQVLDSAFEQLDIKAGNSDSEEDDTNERVELILEPKDLYIDRPLPYLIGSKLFMEQEDVGLGELSSEEGSVGSDRGSIVDSEEENEEEESEEDFANHSDNDQNRHTAQMSDEEDDDDGDIFADSEKEEEDTEDVEESIKPKRNRPTSFADELAARIKGETTTRVEEQRGSSPGEAKLQKTLKEKKERRTPSDDEEDNLFAPPKLTDEDFSPFGSRGGLFSGGKGLFDDEDEESDLFREAPQDQETQASGNEVSSSSKTGKKIPAGAVSVFLDTDVFGASSASSVKEPQKLRQPTAGKSPAPGGLFDDDDDDDDFFSVSCNKPPKTDKIKPSASIFDDEEGDLFQEKAAVLPETTLNQTDENKGRTEKKVTIPSSKIVKPVSETKTQKGLFSDEEDSEDLFSSQNLSKPKDASVPSTKLPKSVSLFDDEDEDEEDNLFGTSSAKKQISSLPTQSQEKAKPSEPAKKKASTLLFSSDEEDQWTLTDSQTNSAAGRSKELKDSGTTRDQEVKVMKKTSLFEEDDDDDDDLFAITKESQKKTQRASLLFEDDVDSGSSLFGSPPPSVPPATMKKEIAPEVPPLLFSDEEEEKEPQLEAKPVEKKAQSTRKLSESGSTQVANESEKEGPLTLPTQEVDKHSDLFSSSSPLDKGTKSRTKTVLSLFDEDEDKTEDQNNFQAPKKETEKSPVPDTRPKSTGVFQDEELLFSHKLQKDNDPDVDLFAGTKKTRFLEPSAGSLFGDDEDDDLFSSAKSQTLLSEKKKAVKKDQSAPAFKNQKLPDPTQEIKEKNLKPEISQDSPGSAPFKTKEPSPRIWKIQANLAINPAALLPATAPQISGAKSVLPELTVPSSESGRIQGLERMSSLPGSVEIGVSFDLPAQADTLHSANKTRVKVKGKRRPQTRAARRLAAQESTEAEDMNVPKGPVPQFPQGAILPDGFQPLPRTTGEESSKEALAAAISTWPSGPVSIVDRSPFGKSLGQPHEDDLFDSEDIFSKSIRSQPSGRTKAKTKAAENPVNPPGESKDKSPMFSALGETGSDEDLFQSVKPKPSKKSNPFPLLEDEDDLFVDSKGKKTESKSNSQQDTFSKAQDIFEDDIFATEAVKPSQKPKEKEKTFESNLFDDNIDIFADLTVKPKEKPKKKVETKSIFDDDMDDIFSSGVQSKTTKAKSRSSQAAPESRSEQKASNIFDDPLNAFGGQ